MAVLQRMVFSFCSGGQGKDCGCTSYHCWMSTYDRGGVRRNEMGIFPSHVCEQGLEEGKDCSHEEGVFGSSLQEGGCGGGVEDYDFHCEREGCEAEEQRGEVADDLPVIHHGVTTVNDLWVNGP